jgi:alpha-1,3-rhamnosyl/mannosyltransferase
VLRVGVDAGNFPRDRRGMGRFARSVVSAARTDPEIELELISLRRSDDAALHAEFGELPLHRPARAGRRDAYDVVWHPWNGMRFRSLAPSLVTIYDAFAFDDPQPEPISRWREQAPIRRAARTATKIATISAWSRGRLIDALGVEPERIAVIPLAPDPYFTPGDDAAVPSALTGRRYVLMVGAREPRKNARTLIAACARALDRQSEMLAIVGKLSSDDARLVADLGVAACEIEAGDEALRTLYRHAAALAVPSSAEGFGLVVVEGMACGVPVLAAAAAALPEAAGDAAQLIEPFDVEAWSRAIRRVLDVRAWADRLRAAGLAHVAAFDRSEPARATIALLREVANLRT